MTLNDDDFEFLQGLADAMDICIDIAQTDDGNDYCIDFWDEDKGDYAGEGIAKPLSHMVKTLIEADPNYDKEIRRRLIRAYMVLKDEEGEPVEDWIINMARNS